MTAAVSPQFSPEENDALILEVQQALRGGGAAVNDSGTLLRLVEGLGDPRGMTRLNFAESLGAIGRPAVPFLVKALRDHANVTVRRAAAKTLTLIEDPEALPDLELALVKDPDPVVQGSAAGAMARCGAEAFPRLLTLLEDPEGSAMVKGLSAWALAFIGSRASELIEPALSSPSVDARAAVVGALADQIRSTDDPVARDLLYRCLDDPAEDVRGEVVTVLGNLQTDEHLPKVLMALEDRSSQVRKLAALALVKIENESAIPHLEEALSTDQEGELAPIYRLALAQLQRRLER